MKGISFATSIILFGLVSGCANNISPHTYSVGSVGQVNRSVAATVISVREVDVTGTSSLGGTTGALTGAVVGSAAGGSNNRANAVGAIAGAVVGGLAGAAIQANATAQRGIEYVVETENGNLMTIVQGVAQPFPVGQKVLVLYGSPSRLIPDPRIR
jgi:outer membrane lipoprotein SlyB